MAGKKQERTKSGVSGLTFIGCLLVGLTIGIWTGEVTVALIGALVMIWQ